jgi:glycerate kinase
VLDAIEFDRHLANADLVLTGEGRLDGQTLGGKALAGIGRRARAQGVPVAALVGGLDVGLDLTRLADEVGIMAVQTIAPGPCSLAESMTNAAAFVEAAAERVGRWMALGRTFRRM